MKMKKWYFMIVSLIFVLAECTDDSEVDEASEPGGSTERTTGKDINVSLLAMPGSLDPHVAHYGYSISVMANIYETLVKMNQDLNPEPALAESYEQLDDTTWEFKLRDDVTYHDGSAFNA